MSNQVQIGICLWCVPDNGSSSMQTVAEMGYSGIVADLGSAREGFPLTQRDRLQTLLIEQDRFEISIPTLAINELCRTGMTDPENFDQIMHILNLATKTAKVLGVSLLQLPSFGKGFIQSEADFASTARCLKYACAVAGEQGIWVGTENALSASDNFKLLEEVDEPNLRIYFDTANPLYLADGMHAPGLLRAMIDQICEVHVKDVSRDSASDQYHFVSLGSGQTDFDESIRILMENNYTGWIHVENKLSDDLLKKDREILRHFFSQ